MNKKIEITKKVLEILNPSYTEKDFKTAINTWWLNPRTKEKGGLGLTTEGYNKLIQAGIEEYFVKLANKPKSISNQCVIWLDKYIDCPFYFKNTFIHLFEGKTAFEMILFNGDIDRFVRLKASKNSN